MDLINSELTNYMEICEAEDIAESVLCYDCGEEAICINEDLLPVGTCMSCGYINSVYKCEHCLLWFDSDEEGQVFAGKEKEFVTKKNLMFENKIP